MAPTPADGSVDRIVRGVDVALVEHAEDDVDGDERRQDQERLVRERRAEGLRRPLEAAVDAVRQLQLAERVLDDVDCAAERRPGRRVEGERDDGELPLVVDDERRQRLARARDRGERHAAAVRPREVDVVEAGRVPLVLRRHLEHDAVLVQFGEDGGDLPLPERVVEGVVDQGRRDPEARGGRAVDRERRL